MKKLKYLSFIFLTIFCFTSCSTSEETTTTQNIVMPESAKAPEVVAFKEALIINFKAKAAARNTPQSSEEKIKTETAVNEASKTFLLANGVSLSELESKTNQEEVFKMAIALYARKRAAISNN